MANAEREKLEDALEEYKSAVLNVYDYMVNLDDAIKQMKKARAELFEGWPTLSGTKP